MPAYRDDLITTRDQLAANIKDLTESPKPSYSVGGQSVSWSELFSTYTQQLEAIEKAIQRSGSPFCHLSRGKA